MASGRRVQVGGELSGCVEVGGGRGTVGSEGGVVEGGQRPGGGLGGDLRREHMRRTRKACLRIMYSMFTYKGRLVHIKLIKEDLCTLHL